MIVLLKLIDSYIQLYPNRSIIAQYSVGYVNRIKTIAKVSS